MTKEKRIAELERCKTVLGWSWQYLGEQIGSLTFAQMTAIRKDPTRLLDGDLMWLQALAAAVEAVPPRHSFLRRVAEESVLRATPNGPETSLIEAPADDEDDETAEHPMTDESLDDFSEDYNVSPRLIDALVAVYHEAANTEVMSKTECTAARWAVSQIAQRLGILDEVKAALTANVTQGALTKHLSR